MNGITQIAQGCTENHSKALYNTMNESVQYKNISVRKFDRDHSTFIKIIIDNIPGNIPTELWLCFISLTGETTKNFNSLRPEEGEEGIDEEE